MCITTTFLEKSVAFPAFLLDLAADLIRFISIYFNSFSFISPDFCLIVAQMPKNIPASFVVAPRLARRLTMAECAAVLGWTDCKNPARTTVTRLQRFEKQLDFKLVHSGIGRGHKSWTTYSALRKAGLIDDEGTMADTVAVAMQSTLDRLHAIEVLCRSLGRTLVLLDARINAIELLAGITKTPARAHGDRSNRAPQTAPACVPPVIVAAATPL